MDRQTLSNYGWIVITVLILAVMLAFATPFGKYIGNGVSNLAMSMAGANDNAMDDYNIEQMGKEWEEKFNPPVKGSATFDTDWDGIGDATLTWNELKDPANGTKYGYNASAITDTSIGSYTFYENEYLISITLPSSVTTIEVAAFYCSYTLKTVILPKGLKTISVQAFSDCHSLESITLPEGLTIIGEGAFGCCCQYFTTITLPSSVTRIGENAFDSCYNLASITFNGTMEQWTAITKGDDWNVQVPATEVICSDGTVSLS